MAQYIVIETHGGLEYANIVQDPETGTNKVFNTYEEAQEEANDCQYGIVFPSPDDNNRNVVSFQYTVEDVIRHCVQSGELVTPSEAQQIFEIIRNKYEVFDESTLAHRTHNVTSQRNWISLNLDQMAVDSFNTLHDFIFFLWKIIVHEDVNFHWEELFTEYVKLHSEQIDEFLSLSEERATYTTKEAAHRQAILDRLLDTLNSSDDVIVHTLCQMVLNTWEHIDEDTAVDVLMGRYKVPVEIYYQPKLSPEEWETGKLPSFGVYRSYEKCKEDYPKHVIITYRGDDIEEHTYMD